MQHDGHGALYICLHIFLDEECTKALTDTKELLKIGTRQCSVRSSQG